MLVLMAITTVVVVGTTALAVDVSKAVATKRSLQAAVDLAALDAVRALGDRYGQAPGLNPQQHATLLAQQSLKANGFDTADTSVVSSYTVTLGRYDSATKTLDPADAPQDAVQVSATINRKFAFAVGSRNYTATGMSSVSSQAGIAVGSFLLRLGGQDTILDALLGGLLGGPLELTLAAYNSLVAARVTLGELRNAMGLAVGTVNQLLSTPVTMAQVISAMASSLQGENATAVSALNSITAAAIDATTFTLGQLVTVAQDVGSTALDVDLNVLGLVQGSVQAANKGHFLSVNVPTLGVPGVATATLQATVVEPPQIAIGPARQSNGQWVTKTRTAQLRVLLQVAVLGSAIVLPIYIEAGSATGELTGITCSTPISNSQVNVRVTRSAVQLYVGDVTQADMTDLASGVTVSPAALITVPILGGIAVYANATVAAGTDNLTFTGQNFNWSAPAKTVGSSSLNLGSLLTGLQLYNGGGSLGAVAGLVWLVVGPLINAALGLVSGVLNVVDGLLDPILGALGVLVGGTDVWAWHLECSGRSLVH
jgi:uncharacterized membrane protein